MKTIHLLILTPYGKYYDSHVSTISFRNDDFTLGITPGHTPLISEVGICVLTLKQNGSVKTFATSGGVIKVGNDEATLILNSIEDASEIDIERVLSAKKRADERMASQDKEIDKVRAEAALERALTRISVYESVRKK